MITSVGYDEGTKILEVKFKNGALYQYPDIEKKKYEKFLKSDSKGTYFSKYIRHGNSTRIS